AQTLPRLWLSRLRTLYASEGKREKTNRIRFSVSLPFAEMRSVLSGAFLLVLVFSDFPSWSPREEMARNIAAVASGSA
ncbi:hypothetical protein MOB49_17680, partial [Bacillus haynesii]|uniref:hypothetical protein n=1 Tax=Bacillus haynesii TaxID=1925021 RepID=UPI00227E0823